MSFSFNSDGNVHNVNVDLRRRSVQASGEAIGDSLVLSLSLPFGRSEGTSSEAFAPNVFIRIGSDGQFVLIMPYVEMGQGTCTSIPTLIAEELDMPVKQVRLEHAPPSERLDAKPTLGVQAIGNSNAMRDAWKALRQAGAAARMILIAAAARRWNVDAKSCRGQNGEVIHVPSGKRLSYGELAIDGAKLPAPGSVTLKSPDAVKLIGTQAIANAIHAATGKRLRKMPVDPNILKQSA